MTGTELYNLPMDHLLTKIQLGIARFVRCQESRITERVSLNDDKSPIEVRLATLRRSACAARACSTLQDNIETMLWVFGNRYRPGDRSGLSREEAIDLRKSFEDLSMACAGFRPAAMKNALGRIKLYVGNMRSGDVQHVACLRRPFNRWVNSVSYRDL